MHCVAPLPLWYVPAEQGVHVPWLVLDVYEPGLHGVWLTERARQ